MDAPCFCNLNLKPAEEGVRKPELPGPSKMVGGIENPVLNDCTGRSSTPVG